MPQNSNFRLPRGRRFFAKNGSYGCGAKSRWGHHRVHLGANGVPLGKQNGSKPEKITMPQNWNFRLSRGHRFFPKNGSDGYGAKSRWGHHRVHFGANGVPLGPIFDYPAVIDFLQNRNPQNANIQNATPSRHTCRDFHESQPPECKYPKCNPQKA